MSPPFSARPSGLELMLTFLRCCPWLICRDHLSLARCLCPISVPPLCFVFEYCMLSLGLENRATSVLFDRRSTSSLRKLSSSPSRLSYLTGDPCSRHTLCLPTRRINTSRDLRFYPFLVRVSHISGLPSLTAPDPRFSSTLDFKRIAGLCV